MQAGVFCFGSVSGTAEVQLACCFFLYFQNPLSAAEEKWVMLNLEPSHNTIPPPDQWI